MHFAQHSSTIHIIIQLKFDFLQLTSITYHPNEIKSKSCIKLNDYTEFLLENVQLEEFSNFQIPDLMKSHKQLQIYGMNFILLWFVYVAKQIYSVIVCIRPVSIICRSGTKD